MREHVIAEWLSTSDWAGWTRTPLTNDASARRYERLQNGSKVVVLMDADPVACGSQRPFVEIARFLTSRGFAAPEIYSWDDSLGVMVLEDLGQADFLHHLQAHPGSEARLYHAAFDVLADLATQGNLPHLTVMTPEIGAEMLGVGFEWAACDHSSDLRVEIIQGIRALLEQVDRPPVLSLRDFHAENLIWRSEETGNNRVGLLDFQDAFLAHPMYDAASLLRDARRDVDPLWLDSLVTTSEDRAAFHCLALQRNIRILGIFKRLAIRDGKAKYLEFLPRLMTHIKADAQAPETRHLAAPISRAFGEAV